MNATGETETRTKTRVVLIVDDSPCNLKIIESMLTADQYRVLESMRGEEGLEIALRERPDLILLDINMPLMDGFEVCERLKARPETADIPIIFLTARANVEDIAKGLRLGAVDYITKPCRRPELLARLENQFELQEAKQALIEDNIQRKAIEKKLQSNLKFLRTLLDTIPDPIFYSNLEDVCQGCNALFANQIAGDSIRHIIGQGMDRLSVFDDKQLRELTEGRGNGDGNGNGDPRQFEAKIKEADGHHGLYAVKSAPYFDEQGQVAGTIGVMRNITEYKKIIKDLEDKEETLQKLNRQLKENQNHLIQSEKMASLGQLAAGVAHEINNPVGFVSSNLGTLKDYFEVIKKLIGQYRGLADAIDDGALDKAKEILPAIKEIEEEEDLEFIVDDIDNIFTETKEGTDRVGEIVQGLKSFARADDTKPGAVDINLCLEQTIKVIWNELKYKCTVHKEFGDLPQITAYAGQLKQVFMNLMVNASHAIKEKGDITIHTAVEDKFVLIKIADNGSGIDPENLSKLFDPFFTTKEVGKGTGLGLSISLGIIQKHQGTIDVESELGKGTTFTIKLPNIPPET